MGEIILNELPDASQILFESAPCPIALVSLDYKFLKLNTAFCDFLGYSEEEMKQKSILDITYKEDRKGNKELQDNLKTGRMDTFSIQKRFVHKSGLLKYGILKANVLQNNEGKPHCFIGQVTDITELKTIEQELRVSNEKYRALYENAPLAYQSLNIEGCFIDVNPVWCKTLGYNREEVLGKWFGDFLADKEKDVFRERFEVFKSKGEVHNVLFTMRRKDDSYIKVLFEGCIGTSIDGRFLQTYCTFKNVTKEIELQTLRETTEKKYQSIFNALNEAVLLHPITPEGYGRFIEVNDMAIELYGYEREEFQKITPARLTSGDADYPARQKQIIQKLLNREEIQMESIHHRKDGQEFWAEMKARMIDLGNDKLILSVVSDITERREAERRIQESEEKYKALIESQNDFVVQFDNQHRLLYISPTYSQQFGVSLDDVHGKEFYPVIHQEDREKVELSLKSLIKPPHTSRHEERDKTVHGWRWINWSNRAVMDSQGQIEKIIAVGRDITERKLLEDELRKQKEKAEESDRLKSAFLANMSHEIRTPLNGILGFSRLICGDEIEEEEKNYFAQIIENSGQRLVSVVNDILDISLIQANQLKIIRDKFRVEDLLQEIHTFYKTLHKKKLAEIDLILETKNNGQHLQMNTDKNRLYQVLKNLIDNSFKFTREGFISFGYEQKRKGFVTFFVKDSGLGISAEDKTKIFNAFEKSKLTDSPEYGGTGLGLSIASGLVHRMGGKIWVESEVDKGASFFFELPLSEEAKNIKPAIAKVGKEELDLSDNTIYVIEDDLICIELLEHLLEPSKAVLSHFINAEDGIKACEKKLPDLVLMDIRLPGMDGYQASKLLRKQYPEIRIIAQTAYAMQGDTQKALEAGCNDYLSKPIDKTILYQKLNKMLRSTAGEEV